MFLLIGIRWRLYKGGVENSEGPAGGAGGEIDQPLQDFGLLRAGDGVLAIDEKARHAVDAQPVGMQIFGMDGLSGFGRIQKAQPAECGCRYPRPR